MWTLDVRTRQIDSQSSLLLPLVRENSTLYPVRARGDVGDSSADRADRYHRRRLCRRQRDLHALLGGRQRRPRLVHEQPARATKVSAHLHKIPTAAPLAVPHFGIPTPAPLSVSDCPPSQPHAPPLVHSASAVPRADPLTACCLPVSTRVGTQMGATPRAARRPPRCPRRRRRPLRWRSRSRAPPRLPDNLTSHSRPRSLQPPQQGRDKAGNVACDFH